MCISTMSISTTRCAWFYVIILKMKISSKNSLIKQHGAKKIISRLQPFVSARRQQRIEQVLDNRLLSLQVALEMPADIQNAFAVIRSCEIFGVAKIHIISPSKEIKGIRPISKGALDWVEILFYEEFNDFLAQMAEENCRLAGALPQAEYHLNAIPLNEPVCLLLGNEHSGLSLQAKKACNWHYQIPMYGMTASLNLSVAAAISLYESTQRKRQIIQATGDLAPIQRQEWQAFYYLNSVSKRLAQNFLLS